MITLFCLHARRVITPLSIIFYRITGDCLSDHHPGIPQQRTLSTVECNQLYNGLQLRSQLGVLRKSDKWKTFRMKNYCVKLLLK